MKDTDYLIDHREFPFDIYDREGRRIETLEEYHRLHTDLRYRILQKTQVGEDVEVSTVWLGMNHAYTPDAPPVIFETMVFGGEHDQEEERYSTEEEALNGHVKMLMRVGRPGVIARDVTEEVIAELLSNRTAEYLRWSPDATVFDEPTDADA